MERDRPPERIEVDDVGVVLRRHRLNDVDALQAAIEESRDHVRPFMIWADQTRDETASFVTNTVAAWESRIDFGYLITEPPGVGSGEPERIIGGTGFGRRNGPDSEVEIGYWLHPDATGRGVITAVVAKLTDVALAMDGIDEVVIHCDEANVKSAAVARRLGYTFTGIRERPAAAPGEHGRLMAWVRRTPIRSWEAET